MTGSAEVPIRPASTVMLVRDAADGVEVFTLRRAASLAFAAGMTVFPGGGVEQADADPAVPWVGPEPAWWAARWRAPEQVVRAHVVAAVRELFEETGVLLAGPRVMPAPGPGPGPADPREVRAELAGHRVSMSEVLRAGDLDLRADLLRPWARWITPPGPRRRYDTYFFLAALPDGQRADHATSEAVDGAWQRPAAVLRSWERDEVGLMPPTVAMMTDLADAASVVDLVGADRSVEPVMPEVLTSDGEVLRVVAAGREYATRMRHG